MLKGGWLFFLALGGLAHAHDRPVILYNDVVLICDETGCRQRLSRGEQLDSRSEREGANERTAEKSDHAEPALQTTIAYAPPPNPPPKREEERAEEDLDAQNAMARWAFWMFVATAAGVGLIAWTLYETFKTSKIADKNLGEAQVANRVAKQALIETYRPHIFVENIDVPNPLPRDCSELPESTTFRFDAIYDVANYGRGPAIITEGKVGIYIGDDLPEIPKWHPGEIDEREVIIPPEGRRRARAFYRGKLTIETVYAVWASQTYIEGQKPTHLYFYGAFTYESVQGARDQIGFIYRYLPYGKGFNVESIPNYTYRRRISSGQGDAD